MATTFGGPASRPDQTLAWNMTLIGHHELAGFGGVGEGMAVQKTKDDRCLVLTVDRHIGGLYVLEMTV